jgi:LPXTG-motif cell wall-anchored protein
MPADAGDEYQGATGASTLTLAAVRHVDTACPDGGAAGPGGAPGTGGVLVAHPGAPELALTGAQGGGLLLAAALLVAAGVTLVRARRRRHPPATSDRTRSAPIAPVLRRP